MWLAYKQSKTNKTTLVKWLAELITSKAYESKILYSLAADFMGDTDSKWYSSKKRRYMMDELERIFKRIDICIKPEIRKEQGKRKIYERRRKMGKSCVDMSPAWRSVSSLRKQCHGELAAGPWLVSCICLLSHEALSAGLTGFRLFPYASWRVSSDHNLWVFAKCRLRCNIIFLLLEHCDLLILGVFHT